MAEQRNAVQNALDIINMVNAGMSTAASLIVLIRRDDGSIAVPVLLDEADKNFDENLKLAQEWRARKKAESGG